MPKGNSIWGPKKDIIGQWHNVKIILTSQQYLIFKLQSIKNDNICPCRNTSSSPKIPRELYESSVQEGRLFSSVNMFVRINSKIIDATYLCGGILRINKKHAAICGCHKFWNEQIC